MKRYIAMFFSLFLILTGFAAASFSQVFIDDYLDSTLDAYAYDKQVATLAVWESALPSIKEKYSSNRQLGELVDMIISYAIARKANDSHHISHFLDEVNSYRLSHGVWSLQYDRILTTIAQAYAEELAQRWELSHTWIWWDGLQERIVRWWYVYSAVAENLARIENPSADSSDTVDARSKSPIHNVNMVNDIYTEIGVWEKDGYWVNVYGTPRAE